MIDTSVLVSVGVGILSLSYIVLRIISPSSDLKITASEATYVSSFGSSSKNSNKKSKKTSDHSLPLPSIFKDAAEVDLSVVVPAYNESKRITQMLDAVYEHLATMPTRTFEVIVVDDCSKDDTSSVALDYGKSKYDSKSTSGELRVVRFERNRQKGGALKHGILHSRGRRVLMVDADGASRFQDIELLWDQLDKIQNKSGHGVAVGSRAHMVNTEEVVKRSFIRNFLMRSFHLVLQILGVGYIRDTQCGFKLFTKASAATLFGALHIHGWIFDVEILLMAHAVDIPVVEVPISWHEIEGSKMNLIYDSVRMLTDLIILRANYLLGIWSWPSLDVDSDDSK